MTPPRPYGDTTLHQGDAGAVLLPTPRYALTATGPGETSTPGAPLPGDYAVVAYRTPGIVAKGIGLATRSRWTHAFTYLGNGMVGEAAPGGYRIRPLDGYLTRSELSWSRRPLTPEQRGQIVQTAHVMAALEIPYGWADIAAIALAAAGVHAAPVMRRLRRPDRLICSAAIAWQYRHARAPLTAHEDDDALLTPSDLAHLNGEP